MDWSLGTFDWSLVATIFFGAVSGYVASRILGGEGFGFFGHRRLLRFMAGKSSQGTYDGRFFWQFS